MSLFKKKEPREIKEDDSLLVKLWYNERSHAAIVLGAYFLLFGIIILFSYTSGSGGKTNNEVKATSLKNLFVNFDNKVLNLNYAIVTEDDTFYFSGSRAEDGIIYGTILHGSDAKDIIIENSICKSGNYNEDGLFIEEGECPPQIDYRYFDYNTIYNWIENLTSKKYSNKDEYFFAINDDLTYRIYAKDQKLVKIEALDKNTTYTLNYKLVENNVEEIINEDENTLNEV